MSNRWAIANVTKAIQARLTSAFTGANAIVTGVEVTISPPDFANKQPESQSRMNVFLYHVVPSAAWRNQMDPVKVKPGETGYPPLGLSLHYILTAFGGGGDDYTAQRMMATAMRVLHDQPLFTPAELKLAEPASDLGNQVERVRITAQPLTTEEMYKLWTAFQTAYRLSAAYEVSVVLIDSTQPIKAPLPVLSVLSGNGPQPNLESPYPTLTAITPPASRNYALLGDILTLTGSNLDTGTGTAPKLNVRFRHRLFTTPLDVVANTVTATSATVQLPTASASWPAGIYSVSCVMSNPPSSSAPVTNEVPLVLAPKISTSPAPTGTRTAAGVSTITVNFSPHVWPGQPILLLAGSAGLSSPPPPPPPPPTTPVSVVTLAGPTQPGPFPLRLRIDGIDSTIVTMTPTQL